MIAVCTELAIELITGLDLRDVRSAVKDFCGRWMNFARCLRFIENVALQNGRIWVPRGFGLILPWFSCVTSWPSAPCGLRDHADSR